VLGGDPLIFFYGGLEAPYGVFEADIVGGPFSVAGSVTGNITSSDRVDLQSGARVIGNVKASRITIADGAQFKGNVDMDV